MCRKLFTKVLPYVNANKGSYYIFYGIYFDLLNFLRNDIGINEI